MEYVEPETVPAARDHLEIRRRAASRVWLCHGAGYALVGRSGLGIVTYLLNVATIIVLAWFPFDLRPAAGWASLALFTAAAAFWFGEFIAVRRASVAPANSVILVRGYSITSVVIWSLSTALAVGAVFW